MRVKWDDRTVALWDNRVTAHTAISGSSLFTRGHFWADTIIDYDVNEGGEGLRQGFRITTLGEVPIGVNELKSEWS